MTRALRPALQTFSLLLALISGATQAHAQAAARAATSKVYVADITGDSHIETRGAVRTLAKSAVHAPEGSSIETAANSTASLVLSNGTALFIGPDARLEFKRFLQQPFSPDRTDLDVEPSVSNMLLSLARGSLGVCTSQLLSGSTMTCTTPHGKIEIRGRRLLIETTPLETRISLLEGDATVLGTGSRTGEVLKPGQQAIVRSPAGAAGTTNVTIQQIPEADAAKLDENVTLACISRRTVFFQSVETPDGGTDLVAVRTAPEQPATQFTVSPARIGN